MSKAKVFFTDMRCDFDHNLLDKLEALIREAGIGQIDFKDKFTAIKIHFGEPGNLAFLRPNYAKVVADVVKNFGGRPFLTDCNTLYVGLRKNAVDHLETAYVNGYSPFSTGCHVIIGDGLKGTDEVEVPVDGELVNKAKIGRAVMDADIVISLNHFKAHECTGIGGALKNLGMGCGSFDGKKDMHEGGKPFVHKEKCAECGQCAQSCAHSAISFDSVGKAGVDHSRCAGCGRCIGVCPVSAIEPDNEESFDMLNKKISEYAAAVVRGRPHFHITMVIDISPYCDCHSENDVALVPDVGMLASFDPVAIDMAAADLCNRQPTMPGSAIDGKQRSADIFSTMHPETDYIVGIDHGQKMGIGSKEYELIVL